MLEPFDQFAEYKAKLVYPLDREQARLNFNDVADAMNRQDLEFWLTFGTLLGAVREHDFIKHDGDTDIGFHAADEEIVINVIQHELMEKGFDFPRLDGCLATVARGGAYIDFYWFHPVKNPMTGQRGLSLNDIIIPDDGFVKTYFAGQCVNIPVKSEVLLARWYGDNWRTPIRGKTADSGW